LSACELKREPVWGLRRWGMESYNWVGREKGKGRNVNSGLDGGPPKILFGLVKMRGGGKKKKGSSRAPWMSGQDPLKSTVIGGETVEKAKWKTFQRKKLVKRGEEAMDCREEPIGAWKKKAGVVGGDRSEKDKMPTRTKHLGRVHKPKGGSSG